MKQELFDVYNENKQKTGRTKIRNVDSLDEGEYGLLTHAIIMNNNKEILISKRSANKRKNPGMWEINGGVCMAGENSLQGIIREIIEELGLDLSKYEGTLIKECKIGKRFDDVWLFNVNIDISKLKLNEECEEAKLITIEEYMKLLNDNKIANVELLEKADYEKCIEILFENKKRG